MSSAREHNSAHEMCDQFLIYLHSRDRAYTNAVYSAVDLTLNESDQFYGHSAQQNEKKQNDRALLEEILKSQDINYRIPDGSFINHYDSSSVNFGYSGYTLLHIAAYKICKSDLIYLLDRGANLAIQDQRGFTPLRLAIGKSYVKSLDFCLLKGTFAHPIVDILLQKQVESKNPANPKCNKDGISHFHIACAANHTRAVEFFLDNGVDVNEAVDDISSGDLGGSSPLHLAARHCCAETIRLLLSRGANKNRKNSHGLTPLYLLVLYKFQIVLSTNERVYDDTAYIDAELRKVDACVDLLADEITDDFSQPIDNSTGLTKLHLACIGWKNVVDDDYLARCGNIDAPVDLPAAIWWDDYSRFDLFKLYSHLKFESYTPLHFAAFAHNVDAFVKLVDYGARIEDGKIFSALDIFADADVVYKILSSRSDSSKLEFSDGEKLIDVVSHFSSVQSFQRYLRSKENVNRQISRDSPVWPGYTLLHLAVLLSAKRSFFQTSGYINVDYTILMINDNSKDSCSIPNLLLYCGADVTIRGANGLTPVHLATYLMKNACMESLLESDASNPRDPYNLCHFQIALFFHRKVESIEKFLNTGINLNAIVKYSPAFAAQKTCVFFELNEGLTPLQVAINGRASEDKLKLLLSGGCGDPSLKSSNGLSALHFAFFKCIHWSIWSCLLEDARILSENSESHGLSHFHAACYAGALGAVESYLAMGADVNALVTCKRNPLSRLSVYTEKDVFWCYGYAPLHLAISIITSNYEPGDVDVENSMDMFLLLVENGADSRVNNADGLTPLDLLFENVCFYSCQNSYVWSRKEHSKKNLIYSCYERIYSDDNDVCGAGLLHVAAAMCDLELVEKSLESGIDVNSRLPEKFTGVAGCTALHLILSFDAEEREMIEPIIELLLRWGADVMMKDGKGRTPIHVAHLKRQDGAIVDMLLNKITRVDIINPIDDLGVSHFHVACARNNVNLVEKFLEHGVDVNQKVYYFHEECSRFTPLHYAVTRHCREVFHLLLEHGADARAIDQNGKTLLTLEEEAYNKADAWDQEPLDAYLDILRTLFSKCVDDANVKDSNGITPLNAFLYKIVCKRALGPSFSGSMKKSEIQCILGQISEAIRDQGEIFKIILDYRMNDLAAVDEHSGRSVLHNLVMNCNYCYRQSPQNKQMFADLIGELIKRGIEVDLRDYKGKTALHAAVIHSNYAAINGLLAHGIDIDIVDKFDKTALQYCTDAIHLHFSAKILMAHIQKMLLVFERNRHMQLDQSCFDELDRMKDVQIFHNFTLRDILRKNSVIDYPSMPIGKRQAIDTFFFESILTLHKTYENFAGLTRLQHQKSIKRLKLADKSKVVIDLISNYSLPDHCVDAIVSYLSIDDLNILMEVEASIADGISLK